MLDHTYELKIHFKLNCNSIRYMPLLRLGPTCDVDVDVLDIYLLYPQTKMNNETYLNIQVTDYMFFCLNHLKPKKNVDFYDEAFYIQNTFCEHLTLRTIPNT